jgi:hypothetical protein
VAARAVGGRPWEPARVVRGERPWTGAEYVRALANAALIEPVEKEAFAAQAQEVLGRFAADASVGKPRYRWQFARAQALALVAAGTLRPPPRH